MARISSCVDGVVVWFLKMWKERKKKKKTGMHPRKCPVFLAPSHFVLVFSMRRVQTTCTGKGVTQEASKFMNWYRRLFPDEQRYDAKEIYGIYFLSSCMPLAILVSRRVTRKTWGWSAARRFATASACAYPTVIVHLFVLVTRSSGTV